MKASDSSSDDDTYGERISIILETLIEETVPLDEGVEGTDLHNPLPIFLVHHKYQHYEIMKYDNGEHFSRLCEELNDLGYRKAKCYLQSIHLE